MQAQAELQQAQAQMQQMGGMPGGGMQAPVQGQGPAPMPQAPAGPQGGARQGSGGSPAFGQNPGNPNDAGANLPQANPATAVRSIASAAKGMRTISDLSTQDVAFGSPTEGAGL